MASFSNFNTSALRTQEFFLQVYKQYSIFETVLRLFTTTEKWDCGMSDADIFRFGSIGKISVWNGLYEHNNNRRRVCLNQNATRD